MSYFSITTADESVVFLKKVDWRLGKVLDHIGNIECKIHDDPVEFIACEILGQMLSNKVATVLRNRLYILLSHNVSNLVYHFVCPAKYRRSVFTEEIERSLKQICEGITLRYEWIEFIEIGADDNHVHFLIQSVLDRSPSEIIRTVKSVTARRIFAECPEVKKWLWGGEFWTDGYFVASVGRNTNEEVIAQYVKSQG